MRTRELKHLLALTARLTLNQREQLKGIATSYLPSYLGWFRALDRNAQAGAKPALLLALAVRA